MSAYGGVEAGGTKFVCAIGSSPDKLEAEISFATTTPRETIDQAIAFFREYQQREKLSAVGVGSFGPVDLNPVSPTFGYITTTPKPDWANTELLGRIRRALGVPVAFDTDVNVAALGEATWGAAKGLETCLRYCRHRHRWRRDRQRQTDAWTSSSGDRPHATPA